MLQFIYNYMSNFNNDLKWGEWAERQLVTFLEKTVRNRKYRLIFNHFAHDKFKSKKDLAKYDLSYQIHKVDEMGRMDKMFIPGKRITFEIKADRYPTDTGNLIFERKCGRKSSGVFGTEATYFVYWLPLFQIDNIFIIKSCNLRQLLETEYSDYLISGGDGNRALLYQIPRNTFRQKFIDYGGYVGEYNIPLPEEMKTFQTKKNILYYALRMKDYENPIDWLHKDKNKE